jgi:hypothetical protein
VQARLLDVAAPAGERHHIVVKREQRFADGVVDTCAAARDGGDFLAWLKVPG